MTPRTEPQTTSSKGRVGPEPRTEAGRTFLYDITKWDGGYDAFLSRILAIEQEAAALSPEPLTVERAIDAMKVSAADGHTPASDWISVGVVKAIIRGDHPILGRLSEPPKP